MSAIYLLIGASILVAIGFLASFIWSVRSGQYEDDYTPSVRILFDDETDTSKNNTGQHLKKKKASQHGSRKNFIR